MKNVFMTKGDKLSEKAFLHSLVISVVGILICIVALCSATYAWFSGNLQSNTNNIKAAHFSISVVSVVRVESDENALTSETEILPNALGIYELGEGTYTITVRPTDETTAKGYCVIRANGAEYRTDVLINENTISETYPTSNSPFVFYVKLSESGILEIDSRWGVPVDPTVGMGGTIDMTVLSPIGGEAGADQ